MPSVRRRWTRALLLLSILVAAAGTYVTSHLDWLHLRQSESITGESAPTQFEARPGSLKVVDGDTVRFRGRRLRLLAIDAPEVRDYRCTAEREAGLKAQQALEQMISGKAVTIRFAGERDQYDRELVDLIVEGQDIAQTLIERDLALPFGSGKGSAGAYWCGAP